MNTKRLDTKRIRADAEHHAQFLEVAGEVQSVAEGAAEFLRDEVVALCDALDQVSNAARDSAWNQEEAPE